ncbi:uncharacterized protein LOC111638433 isoform X2 [Centruroides sculpturatus]|uniref:uncharacterized protein LOC111638433 isoform X2 n=1 Tax=Centruroides sculpturatus TaxID=218467 RepID=UPI000C6EBDF5|nr:uncharacterized protein LOC111638433 isoform X2 [Centruroides sculpturatus]
MKLSVATYRAGAERLRAIGRSSYGSSPPVRPFPPPSGLEYPADFRPRANFHALSLPQAVPLAEFHPRVDAMMVDGSPNRGVTVANPAEGRRESAVGGQNVRADRNGKEKEPAEEKKDEAPARKLEVSAAVSAPHSSRSRWLKLRTTVQLTGAITQSHKKPPLKREDSFLKRFSTRQVAETNKGEGAWFCHGETTKDQVKRKWWSAIVGSVINPDENFLFGWLWLLTAFVLYNAWTLIVRQAFPELHGNMPTFWYVMDGLSDFFFFLDIVVQFRTGYLEQGLMVCDAKKLASHYLRSRPFLMDLAALTPLDTLQFLVGNVPILRLPRFLKVYRSVRFYYMAESRTIYPNLWRVVNLVHILLLLAHWFGCFYYMLSELEQFEGEWAFPHRDGRNETLTRKYLGSVYWSTLTLTTIGDLATPATNLQYLFTIVSYLIGVFIFATIVGQVGNVITNRNASRLEFERLLDGAKLYMRHHKVPRNMQRRVQRWYDYSWSRGRMQGGGDIHSALGSLPDKLKTELALHVNLKTLKKVSIFQECQPEFLHDLVLKMKAYIFTPGDLICRKGEVAREMFIIADGILEVINELGKVLTQMKAGDFFGEIGILNLDGFNRRTADVRSVGYSELFSLSREDVLAAMKDYPEAQEILQTMGRKRLMEARLSSGGNKKHEDRVDATSPTGLRASRNRESIDACRSREMVKRIKHDVQSLRGLLRSKSIPVRQVDESEEMELQSLTSRQKSRDTESGSDINSIRKFMRKIRWKGDGESSRPLRGLVRKISCIKPQLSSDANDATVPPSLGSEPIGKGLPLLERIKLLKEKERINVEGEGEKERGSAGSDANTVIGEGLPLLERIKLLKAKEEAAVRRNSEAQSLVGGKEVERSSELPLLKRVLLLKSKEEQKPKSEESEGKPSNPEEQTIKLPSTKKPNAFQLISKSINVQKQENRRAAEDSALDSKMASDNDNENPQSKCPKLKLNGGGYRIADRKEHPNRESGIESQLSTVVEHAQSPPPAEIQGTNAIRVGRDSAEESTNEEKGERPPERVDRDPRNGEEDAHATRRARLRRMLAVAENTRETSSTAEAPKTVSKDAWSQTEEDWASKEKTDEGDGKMPVLRKSPDRPPSSDGEEATMTRLRARFRSTVDDSLFDDGLQEYLIKIMKNVRRVMKTYVMEKQTELRSRVAELEEELRKKKSVIRRLRCSLKDDVDGRAVPLTQFALLDDESSYDDSDVTSPDTDTENDLLLSSSGLVFEPDDIWRVEFPANGVFSGSTDNNLEEALPEANDSFSSEGEEEEEMATSCNWEAKMLVEEFEKNRRRSTDDAMLWSWMVNRKSLQEWRRSRRQGNRTKRKLSLVDERTLDTWSAGTESLFHLGGQTRFSSTERLVEAAPSSPGASSKRIHGKEQGSSAVSGRKIRKRGGWRENPGRPKKGMPRWSSLDDGGGLKLVSGEGGGNCRVQKRENVSTAVLGWPSSPCLPTITEDDYHPRPSRPRRGSPPVSRSYSQDCLTGRSASSLPAECRSDDGASERHSESSEHGEESPLIPFAQCSDDSVVIDLPEYQTLLDP